MTDLADFLLARFADDEAVANGAANQTVRWRVWSNGADGGALEVVEDHTDKDCVAGWVLEEEAAHIALWDPARVLAECEAKRQIVEWHRSSHECSGPEDNCMWIIDGDECPTLRALAIPYSDHPDYREDWRL